MTAVGRVRGERAEGTFSLSLSLSLSLSPFTIITIVLTCLFLREREGGTRKACVGGRGLSMNEENMHSAVGKEVKRFLWNEEKCENVRGFPYV